MTLEVSLRKATKLRSKTSDLIKTLSNRIVLRRSNSRRYGLEDEVSGGMQVSVYTPSDQLTTMLSTKRAETLSRFEKIKELYGAAYGLRVLINEANNSSGVSAQLALASQLEALIDFYKSVLNTEQFDSPEVAEATLRGMRERAAIAQAVNVSNTVSLPIFYNSDKAELQTRIDEHTLSLSAIHDKIEFLNATTKVVLPEQLVNTLASVKLL